MMADTTPRLGLPELVAAQAQKHVTVNEALIKLDALVDLYLTSMALTTPPGSPADGDAYLVATGGTGAWTNYDGKIAYCIDGGWRFYTPANGMRAYNAADGIFYIYIDGSWTNFASSLSLAGSALASGKLLVGNASGQAAAVAMSGDATMDGSGALSLSSTIAGTKNFSGRIGVGIENIGFRIDIGGDNDTRMHIHGVDTSGMYFTTDGGYANTFRCDSSGFSIYTTATLLTAVFSTDGSWLPGADGGHNLGSPSRRFNTLFAATPSINTSDSTSKTDVRAPTDAEISAALKMAANIRIFRYIDAVAEKGAAARLHVGMIADSAVAHDAAAAVQTIMEGEGLDPSRYGFWCRDTEPVTGADGNPVYAHGLRYVELLAFILMGERAARLALEARVAALEAA